MNQIRRVWVQVVITAMLLTTVPGQVSADHNGDWNTQDSSGTTTEPVGTKCRQTVEPGASRNPFTGTDGLFTVTVTLDCVPGMLPERMTVDFYKASVQTPNSNTYVRSQTIECGLGGSSPGGIYEGLRCQGVARWYGINKTMHVKATSLAVATCMTACGLADAGKQLTGTSHMLRVTFNDKGVPYPKVRSTRGDQLYVPFPKIPNSTSWVKCPAGSDTDKSNLGCYRDPAFRNNVVALYRLLGWTVPITETEAHHICPRQYQDCSSDPKNGVLLSPNDHDKLTDFWRDFNPRWYI